jgi:hypothetical protein
MERTDEAEQTERSRLTITIEGIDTPINPIRQAIHDALAAQVGDALLENYEIDADRVTVSEGHQYTQISDRCPTCDTTLELAEIHADTANGAHASARCSDDDCEWRGTAVYRLIDLESRSDDTSESVVSSGKTTPDYYPY